MFISPAMIIIIFKLATLIIVAAIVIYGYVYYIQPAMRQILEEKYNAYTYMLKRAHALDQQQQGITEQTRKAQENAQNLMQKIILWKTSITREQEERMHEKEQLTIRFVRLYRARQLAHTDEQTRISLTLHALHAAEQELIECYQKKPDEAQKYVITLVESLRNQE